MHSIQNLRQIDSNDRWQSYLDVGGGIDVLRWSRTNLRDCQESVGYMTDQSIRLSDSSGIKMMEYSMNKMLRRSVAGLFLMVLSLPGCLDVVGQQPGGSGSAPATRSEFGVWGYVGVYLGDATADLARRWDLGEVYGVLVGTVEAGSPAAGAGLRSGDLLLTLDGVKILNRLQFFQVMMDTPPGKRIHLGLLRNGERIDVEFDVGRRLSQALLQRRRLFSEPDSMVRLADENRRMAVEARAKGDEKGAERFLENEATLRQMADDSRTYIETELREGRISEPVAVQNFNLNLRLNSNRYKFGLTVVSLTDQLAAYFNAGDSGLLISEVRSGSAAEAAGLKPGDCLVSLNSIAMRTPAELNQAVDRAVIATPPGKLVEMKLVVVSDRTAREINLKL